MLFRRLDQLWRMCSSGKYDWHKLHSCLGSKYLVYTHFGQPVVERPTTTGLKISKRFAENALAFTQFLSSLAELFCQAVNYSYVNPRETDPKSKPQWEAKCAKRTAFHQNGASLNRLSPNWCPSNRCFNELSTDWEASGCSQKDWGATWGRKPTLVSSGHFWT